MIEKIVPDIIEYTKGILDNIFIQKFPSKEEALLYFNEHKTLFTCNILSCFEGIQLSLSDTEKNLNGYSVSTVNLDNMIKNKIIRTSI